LAFPDLMAPMPDAVSRNRELRQAA
jgi:hypothetical protein